MSKKARCLHVLTAAALAAAFIGCESSDKSGLEGEASLDPQEINDSVFWDHTPELLGPTQRSDDYAVQITRRFNVDSRLFWEDWINALYWDRPTRLNRRPLP